MVGSYLQSLMGDKEEILLVCRQHWFVLTSAILLELLAAAAIVVGITFLLILFPPAVLGYILLVIPLIFLIRDFIVWYNRQYIVTNRRIIQISGIFNKNVIDSSLEKVNDVKMSQSVFGRIFNYGNVEILTASEYGVNLFKRIGDPIRFKTTMLNAKEKLGMEEFSGMVHMAPDQENIPQLIEQLDELRKKGILSEAEFLNKKQELLDKLK